MASTSIDLTPVLQFLTQLQDNNNKTWFEANRAAYTQAKERFERLVECAIDDLRAIEDLGDLSTKDCVMRIFRDVRFSKDKSPYKTNFAAAIAAGGKKSPRMPYYLHVAPRNESFIAGGLYAPTAEQLARFRETIDSDAATFKALVSAKSFEDLFGDVSGEKLKTVPKGYSRDREDIELLKLKQVYAHYPLSDAAVLDPGLQERVLGAFTELKPLLDYLNEVVLT